MAIYDAAWGMTPPGEVHPEDADSPAYHRFRPGITFQLARDSLEADARRVWALEGRRMFITRSTVLGRMHEMKQSAWKSLKARQWQIGEKERKRKEAAREAARYAIEVEGLPF